MLPSIFLKMKTPCLQFSFKARVTSCSKAKNIIQQRFPTYKFINKKLR